MPSCAARWGVVAEDRADSSPTFTPARCAQTKRNAVANAEPLALTPVGVNGHGAVGQDAVHVEEQQLDARCFAGQNCAIRVQGFWVPRFSVLRFERTRPSPSRDRAGAPRPPRVLCSRSTTTIDVILRCSMMFSASTGERRRRNGHWAASHHLGWRSVRECWRLAPSAGEGRRR